MSEGVIAGAFAALVAVLAWLLNEYARRRAAEYVRKEKRYQRLVTLLRGFYVESFDRRQRLEFLDELNLCWLYCPDSVIRRAYAFMDVVHVGSTSTPEQRHLAAGELLAAIRRDLFSRTLMPWWRRTRLAGTDLRHFGVGEPLQLDA